MGTETRTGRVAGLSRLREKSFPKEFRGLRRVRRKPWNVWIVRFQGFPWGALILSLAVVLATAPVVLRAHPAEVPDQGGRTIRVDRPFTRILSLYGAHTENLFHLGLDREIIGVSRNEAYPEAARSRPWFSVHDSLEKFLAAEPDLVLIRPMLDRGYPELMAGLERAGITVASFQPEGPEEMYGYWLALGRLTGREEKARAMAAEFREAVEGLRALTRDIPVKKRVYFEAIHDRMKTFSPGSIPLFVLEAAGGVNVATDAVPSRGSAIGVYGKERILARAGEIDVFLAQTGLMNPVERETIVREPGFSVIRAVAENQVFLVDEMLVARPGFRLLTGIRRIMEILYPDRFDTPSTERKTTP
jgi:iron complex transport system substrate-binding protein